jgi:heme oxygenase (biliverdin-IX-beta and delta-forming)
MQCPHLAAQAMRDVVTREPLSALLKSTTRAMHDDAEGHAFHAELFAPATARACHVRMMGQNLTLQQTFEPLLFGSKHPVIASLVRPHHARLELLKDDLAALGATAEDLEPLPATRAMADFFRICGEGDSPALLGAFYVIEGATNGGTIIAMRVKQLLNLPDDRGTQFMNPHGQQTAPRWREWKAIVDAADIDDNARTLILHAAGETFRHTGRVMSDAQASLAAMVR